MTMDIEGKIRTVSPDENGMERCVVCGRPTELRFSTPIELRRCYVEGAGQLCPKCWAELYAG